MSVTVILTYSFVCQQRGPFYLGVYDLASVKKSGAIFIRKVTKSVDPNLYHIFPVNELNEIPLIDWPHEVLIGKKPDWGEYKEHVRRTGKLK